MGPSAAALPLLQGLVAHKTLHSLAYGDNSLPHERSELTESYIMVAVDAMRVPSCDDELDRSIAFEGH